MHWRSLRRLLAPHLGFHLRAYIKWQNGDPADAQRYSREVERISRMTAPHKRAEALADSARCLAQLERDLSDAEAFVNEAELLADADQPPAGLPLARGILTLFRGDHAQAQADLERARQIAARDGNRLEGEGQRHGRAVRRCTPRDDDEVAQPLPHRATHPVRSQGGG